jgi:biopolymer transport protein ExbB
MSPILANVVLDFFVRGGPIMWPILFCLIASITVVLERALWWYQHSQRSQKKILDDTFHAISEGHFAQAVELSSDSNDPFLTTVQEGLVNAHSSMLGAMQLKAMDEIEKAEKRLWMLNTFITLAPLLGLLGTVTGIMHSFNFVGGEELAATKVSGGIAEALIATAAGLGIAIVSLLPYNFFNRKLTRLRSSLEKTINHVELLVESAKHHGHDLEAYSRQRAISARQAPQSKHST